MDQAIHARGDLDESAELGQPDDLATDAIALLQVRQSRGPGVWRQLLQAQRDLAAFAVELENLHLQLLANSEQVGGFFHPLPTHFGHMQQTIDTREQLDESAELSQAAHPAFHD